LQKENIIKIKFIFNFLFSIIFLFFSISIFSFISFPLLSIKSTEIEPIKFLDFTINKVPEYDLKKNTFWWLTQDENIITIINRGDERIKFEIILLMSQNPCKEKTTIEIQYLSKLKHYNIDSKQRSTVSLGDFILKPFEKKNLYIQGNPDFRCYVKNGDTRNFLVKLEKIEFKYE